LRQPDVTFDDEAKLDLGGGVTVRLLFLGAGHTASDELIFVEPDKALITGDIVQNKVQATLLAATAAAAAEEAAKPVARSQVRGDLSYRARSLKVLWRAEIEDVFLTLIYFQDRPEVRDLLTRLACAEAPAAHRDGKEIPGCRLYPIEAAA